MVRTCKECGKEFVITGGEIRFYKSKKLQFPRRCKQCRGKGKNSVKTNEAIVILYASSHHGNTQKVVEAMREVSGAVLVDIHKDEIPDMSNTKALGVATGIYKGKPDEKLRQVLSGLNVSPAVDGFVVTTSGSGKDYSKIIRKWMNEKHIGDAGSFTCKGFDTFGIFKLFGGIAKGHPNEKELSAAKQFAKELTAKYIHRESEKNA